MKAQRFGSSATGFHDSGVLLDLSHHENVANPLGKECRAFGLFHTSSRCVQSVFADRMCCQFGVFKAAFLEG